MTMNPLKPGSTIGFLGGGQLARMLAMAATSMGYKTVFLEPDPNAPAREVSQHIQAPYTDEAALARLAELSDVVTLEFENVPDDALNFLESRVPVYPQAQAFRVSRNRILEKQILLDAGLQVAPYLVVRSEEDLEGALSSMGGKAILKTAELGYDGKGQARVSSDQEALEAFRTFKVDCVLESFVPFVREISVQIARAPSGYAGLSGIVENVHHQGILKRSIFPARVSEKVVETARDFAIKLAEHLNLVGLLTLELFVLEDDTVLVNEIAPRVHNSGHLTMNGGGISQFEAQIRAVTDLPQWDFEPFMACSMVNVLGWEKIEPEWDALTGIQGAHLHLYGKANRPGRKVGHLNIAHFDPNVVWGSTKIAEMLLFGDVSP